MSNQKSWQEEEREENARRTAQRVERLEIKADWLRSGKPGGFALCLRLKELLEFASIGVSRCRFCGAFLYEIPCGDDLQYRRFYGRDGSEHWCDKEEQYERQKHA